MTIAIPQQRPRLIDLLLPMVRIRRGGKRIRGTNGGRTRKQDCCCDPECDKENVARARFVVDGWTGDCSTATADYTYSNINGAYETTDIGPTIGDTGITALFNLGSVSNYADPGILVRTQDLGGGTTRETYLFRIDFELICYDDEGTLKIAPGLFGVVQEETIYRVRFKTWQLPGPTPVAGTGLNSVLHDGPNSIPLVGDFSNSVWSKTTTNMELDVGNETCAGTPLFEDAPLTFSLFPS